MMMAVKLKHVEAN